MNRWQRRPGLRQALLRQARRTAVLVLAGAVPAALVAGPAAAAPTASQPAASRAADRATTPMAGGHSVGDSLFPTIGNTGYDVTHYGIALAYASGGTITATTTIQATAARALSSFSFDLEGLTVDAVRVDGRVATFTRQADKLVVTPAGPVAGRFTTVVGYHGRPVTHIDPDGSKDGWIPGNGGATALNEPVGAQTWYPDNNTPRDKATFDLTVGAPSTLAVASNGVLRSRVTAAGRTTWTWHESRPMATYLSTVSIGHYTVTHTTLRLRDGRQIPVWSFVEPTLGSLQKTRALIKPVIAFGERQYGAYPFDSVGIVVAELNVGYSLETQTRPFFDGTPSEGTLVHELAHQWYGDSVTPRDWGDIWLNEGFASYAEHNWAAAHGGKTTWQAFQQVYDAHGRSAKLWRPAPAALKKASQLFGDPVYARGALTLEALRHKVGSATMTQILRRWSVRRRYGVASTADFVALAERVSDRNLGTFFHTWLYVAAKPRGY